MGAARSGPGAQGCGLTTGTPIASGSVAADPDAWLNFYGRRKGKTLRKGQANLVATRLAELAPPGADPVQNPDAVPIALDALFPGARAVWLEIGFGGGEHMVAQAMANPDVGLIGAEAFLNGVAMALGAIERAGLHNIRIHADDVRFLMDRLPDASIERAFLNYPDPWPKRRHIGRRFVQPATRNQLARLLTPGAEFRLATDIADYVAHTVAQFAGDDRFRRLDHDPSQAWPDWPGTRYEAKALREGRSPHYLTWTRT